MKEKIIHIFRSYPLYLWLLPVFFVLHGLNEYFDPSLVTTALWLALLFIGIGSVLAALGWLFFKDLRKAGLVAFMLLAYNFFFGSAYDFMRKSFGNSFIVRYTFILPVTVLIFVLLIIYVKKTKRNLSRTQFFLNALFLVLIFIDLAVLVPKLFGKQNILVADLSKTFIPCDTCSRPDIYLIIADEYAGKQQLEDLFSFDNSSFEAQLEHKGFHVIRNSSSNYNATVYSMASMLNMEYVTGLRSPNINHPDMIACRRAINKNNVLLFLKEKGYAVSNYSFFEFDNKPNPVVVPFFPNKTSFFIAQTFYKRFLRDLGFHFVSSQRIERIKKNNLYNDLIVDSLLRVTVNEKSIAPKFVYVHFAKPHHPYFHDSLGREFPSDSLTEDFRFNKPAYVQNLIYTNKKLLALVDFIKERSAQPPVIILAGDHGFRQLPDTTARKYLFMNLNAVFLPGQDYSGFYEGMSNVNEFRVILNAQFGQRFPLLKDSTIFLLEPGSGF